jgi:protocatechuate 3,4-dioxygenase beta subunit
MAIRAISVTFLLLISALARAQVIGRPEVQMPPGPRMAPRDRTAPEVGTSIIRGRVLSSETGFPLRRAQVRLFGERVREGRVATTDAEGRFELKDLPAGRYQLSASKGGYVTINYGQRRPFEPGRPIELADGQTMSDVSLALPRGSALSGRIVDEFGEPVADAHVSVMRYQFFNGERRLVPVARFDQTDDGGNFRIYGLSPGDYYVSANLQSFGPFAQTEDRAGYAATYYPGTGSPAQAEKIPVGLGTEVSGITFSLLPVRTARITGSVLSSSGKPLAGAMVMLTVAGEGGVGGGFMTMSGARPTGPDGSFTIANVAPGDYTLVVRSGGMGMGMGPGSGSAGPNESAFQLLTVAGDDISGLALVASAGTTIRGQIVFEQPPPASVTPSSVGVFAMPASNLGMFGGFGGAGRDRVNDDWTFELRAQMGPVLIRSSAPSGYILKAVYHNATDVTDAGIAFKSTEPITGVQVVLTNRQSQVSGTVADTNGKPVTDYVVVVFAEEKDKWTFQSRYLASGRPDQQGTFQVRGLPPGRYLAAAVEYIEQGQHTDPELLEQLRPRATVFDLGEGEQRTMNLVQVPPS